MTRSENLETVGVKKQLSCWLVKKLTSINKLKESEISLDKPVANYGLDSLHALAIAGELEEMLDIELPSTMLWQYPTIEKITQFIYDTLLGKNQKS